jgi:hypothetical protein
VLSNIWDFVKDTNNQSVISWIGGGMVVVGASLWAALKEKHKSAFSPTVHADRGGIAAGRDIRDNTFEKRVGGDR